VIRPLFIVCALVASMFEPPQVFKARTDLVRIDALVEDKGRPITTLSAHDFIVTDNGVEQHVAAAGAVEAVNLSVLLDVSGSMSGGRLERSAVALEALLANLQQRDRCQAFAFANSVVALGASTTLGNRPADRLRAVVTGGNTALADAAYTAILESDTGAGPKLLLVITDGHNNASWLEARDVIDAAHRRETVIYPVAVGITSEAREEMTLHQLAAVPGGDGLALLRIFAEETGGRVITSEWTANLGDVFRAILQEYRQRYLLTFTPEGVSTNDGWHTLEVKLKRGLKGRVHARRGYLATP
jgi:VWFA-related protein